VYLYKLDVKHTKNLFLVNMFTIKNTPQIVAKLSERSDMDQRSV